MLGYKMNLRKINSVKQGYDFIFLAELAFLFIIKWIFFCLGYLIFGGKKKEKNGNALVKKERFIKEGNPKCLGEL